MPVRVAIVYNQPEPVASDSHWRSRLERPRSALPPSFHDPSEYGILEQVRGIERALRELGHDPRLHAVVNAAELAGFLAHERPDVVFNCCESFRRVSALEMGVAALFDLFGVAYTGSPALTLGIALDKGLTKCLLQATGIPTPRHVVMRRAADLLRPHGLAYPLIVKPVAEDASVGIDGGAVVYDQEATAKRVRFVWAEFKQPALVEEFIDGRELNVALLADSSDELEMLPVSEVLFEALPPEIPRVVSYDAKWVSDSVAYGATPTRCPAPLDAATAERVRQMAKSAAEVVGVRDYGRVDMRVRASDSALFVLEINPNPDLSEGAGFMRAASASGRTPAETVRQILERAVDRARQMLPALSGAS